MEYMVLSKSKAIRYSYKSHEKSSIIISIQNSYDLPEKFLPSPNNNIKEVLYLTFDDIDSLNGLTIKKDEGMVIDNYNQVYAIISDEDAQKIVDFVKKYQNTIDRIIVHCEAGISRSSGVCAAIMKFLEDDDSEIFNNPSYSPNMRCYRTVLNKFWESIDKYENT